MTKEELLLYLEETRKGFLDSVARLTEEQMYTRIAPDEWTVAEILAHLPVAERHLLGQARAVYTEGLEEIRFMSRDERQTAAERSQQMVPPQMVNDMIGARRQTLKFIDGLTDIDLDKPTSHRKLGPMTLGSVLRTIGYHESDHEQHVRRLRDAMAAAPGEASPQN